MSSEPIRVFVACAPDGLDAESQAVVEYSLRRHASRPIELTWMRLDRDPASPFCADGPRGWQTQNWATPFSWLRWAIPHLCGNKGRAIYSDSDVMFLDDVAKLDELPMEEGKAFISKSPERLCVSAIDCERLGAMLPSFDQLQKVGPINYKNFRHTAWQPFKAGENWNCVDGDGLPPGDPSIRAIHFSDIATQPQMPLSIARLAGEGRRHWFEDVPVAHPRPDLAALFMAELDAALAAGYDLARYNQTPPYGTIVKRNLTGYSGGPRWTAPATK